MLNTRRQFVVLLPWAGGLACGQAAAALFEPDVQDVEVGSSSTSVLDPSTSRRLRVQTKLVGIRTTRWVDKNGRTHLDMGSLTQNLYENKYDRQTSVNASIDIWRITAEELKEPALMVLRVRSTRDYPLLVGLFPGTSSAGSLDPEIGIQVPPSDEASNEWLGLFRFDPKVKTFVTVQAQEAERVPYRIAVLPASRFRR